MSDRARPSRWLPATKVFRAKAWVLMSQAAFAFGSVPESVGGGVEGLGCDPGGVGLGGLGLKGLPRLARVQNH